MKTCSTSALLHNVVRPEAGMRINIYRSNKDKGTPDEAQRNHVYPAPSPRVDMRWCRHASGEGQLTNATTGNGFNSLAKRRHCMQPIGFRSWTLSHARLPPRIMQGLPNRRNLREGEIWRRELQPGTSR
jgi:hypothetical protein